MRSTRPTLQRRLARSLLLAGITTLLLSGGLYLSLDVRRSLLELETTAQLQALSLAEVWQGMTR